ncbi:MAG TPA: hypothetical protein VGD78_02860 [Chthoniobacterales bacterium]
MPAFSCDQRRFRAGFCFWLCCLAGLTGQALLPGTALARGFWVEDRTAILTERSIRHIEERHWPTSDAPGAGKFAEGITVDVLSALVNEAVTNGTVKPNTHGRPGQTFEYDFHRPIGVNIQGLPASRLRVVVAPNHTVITAFPF